jgi:ubiquinone/menaquinone biosynthesis C-methylase UbiE
MRQYRRLLVEAGQASPPGIASLINKILDQNLGNVPVSSLDVGCGLGTQMQRLKSFSKERYKKTTGLDWSPATVKMHSSTDIYDDVKLADSSALPFEDKQFDLSISMENLEHLYGNLSVESLKEMARVSNYIVISTPLPHQVINFSFLKDELLAANLDKLPLTLHDYVCLESAIHKSTLFPSSLTDAGFVRLESNHGVYFGESRKIDFEKIISLGIEDDENELDSLSPEDLKKRYIDLLVKSASLHDRIVSHDAFSFEKSALSGLDYRRLLKLFIPPIFLK